MCKKRNLFFKTLTLVFYVYYVTNNPILQAMETESFTESRRSTGYPVNKELMLVRDLPTTPDSAAILNDDKQLVNKTIKTERFAEIPRYVTWQEKTELTLVCDHANTSTWVSITHEYNDLVFDYSSKFSSVVSYTLPSLSCKDMGHYTCRTNTTRHIYVLVFGCPLKLCLRHDNDKVLEADLGQDVMFDVCVLIPSPFSNMPITVNYKNTWLYKGQCVSRLCVTWTNVEFYRFNVKIIISNVSKEDYGEINLKFSTSHAYENYTFNYFPLLLPRTMRAERFTASPRHVGYLEKTALMLVCRPPNTSDWAAILHDDKVLVKKRSLSAKLLYTFQSLSCNDSGQYLCITNTTHDINLSVVGCTEKSNDRNIISVDNIFIYLVMFCIIGFCLLGSKNVRQRIQQFRQDFVSKCFCLRQNESRNQNRVSETVPANLSVYDSCPEQNPEPSVEHVYDLDNETTNPKNLYDDIQDTSQNSRHLNPVDDYMSVV